MADRWIDCSSWQPPEKMHWQDWGIPRGQYRLALGRKLDPTGPLHRTNMRAAGMKTGSYAVPVEYAPILDQAWFWVDNTPDDDENDDWVDAERHLLTESMLRAYCDSYDTRSRRQRLAIYTGKPWWMSHVAPGARARYAGYKLIIAGYPFDTPSGIPAPMDPASVARRTTPPTDRRPAIPPPWTIEDGWQYSGQGGQPGYGGFLDMGIYRVNPSAGVPPVVVPPPATHPVLVGLHGRADGRMQPADFATVRQARIEAVKLLTTAAPEDVDALRAIRSDMFISVRLFADFRGRVITPADFARDSGMGQFYARGVRHFEIHNEPNLAQEGLSLGGSVGSWRSGAEFGAWFEGVRARLKAQFPEARFGFPGLSPGGDVPLIRMDAQVFMAGAQAQATAADWIGLHVYWNDDAALADALAGRAAREMAARFGGKPIYITEFSNALPIPKGLKGDQYVRFYKACQSFPNVVAAFSFVVSSSAQFATEAWRDEDGTQTEITAIVGARDAVGPPVPVKIIARGSKIGIHSFKPRQVLPLVAAAASRGVTWPVVKAIADAGVAVEVKSISPRTITITRFVNLAEDPAQDVDRWTPAEMIAHARNTLSFAMGNTARQAQLRAATDYIEPLNEADPPGAHGYAAFGRYLCELVRQADALGIKLALPGLNSGTPEWAEMVALADTGLFGLMKAGGHILTLHEGTVRGNPVDVGYDDRIPGAPKVAGSGSICFRYRYLYHLLRMRGEVVPLVISEFYSGSYLIPPKAQIERFAWYDREARRDPYVLGVLPFTIDATAADWADQDYTPIYSEVLNYLDREKNLPNVAEENEMDEPIRLALIDDWHAAQASASQVQAKAAHSLALLAALAPPAPPAWWETKTPPYKLAATGKVIPFYNADGSRRTSAPTERTATAQWDVFARSGNMLKVYDPAGTENDWWVRAQDVTPGPGV